MRSPTNFFDTISRFALCPQRKSTTKEANRKFIMNTMQNEVVLTGRAGGDGKETECEKQGRQKDRKTEHKKKHHHHHHKHTYKKPPHTCITEDQPATKQETSGTLSYPKGQGYEDKRAESPRLSRQSPLPDAGPDDMQGRRSTNTKVNEKNITKERVSQAALRNKAPVSVSAQKVSMSTQEKEAAKLEKGIAAGSSSAKIHENHLAELSSTNCPPGCTALVFDGCGEESAMYRVDAL